MENKQTISKKRLLSIDEEKFIREVDYDRLAQNSCRTPRGPQFDLEILQKRTSFKKPSPRVLVSIKPRRPAIKTLFIAEKSRYCNTKAPDYSRLAVGDHRSFTAHNSDNECYLSDDRNKQNKNTRNKLISKSHQIENSDIEFSSGKIQRVSDDYVRINCTHQKQYDKTKLNSVNAFIERNTLNYKEIPKKVDIATLIVTNSCSEDSFKPSASAVEVIVNRLANLEKKLDKQEMVLRSIHADLSSSSEDDSKQKICTDASSTCRPGCSYIQQYSQVPQTSAFHRCTRAQPLSPSKATSIEKEHNSEQYRRNFTTYDNLTSRGRRQSASVPFKKEEAPRIAAERVHRIRHKLNPVRDYRLMDTVHYLAQGEFAPRDDGIKLTPSREAVLSDIIWEDVCRTHWPHTRLGRRPERNGNRHELQRLIDGLLRERVAHVERRRRRHYRILKINHRHDNDRLSHGKTGDIIVANHKNRIINGNREVIIGEQNASEMLSNRKWNYFRRKINKSHDQFVNTDGKKKHRFSPEECSPGPSYANCRKIGATMPTCCFRTSHQEREELPRTTQADNRCHSFISASRSSSVTSREKTKKPRFLAKKDYRRKHNYDSDLEHYILLPTLVIRTPSNVKRQKKFNELYHRILNDQINNDFNGQVRNETKERDPKQKSDKRDIGININVNLSSSSENISKKKSQ